LIYINIKYILHQKSIYDKLNHIVVLYV